MGYQDRATAPCDADTADANDPVEQEIAKLADEYIRNLIAQDPNAAQAFVRQVNAASGVVADGDLTDEEMRAQFEAAVYDKINADVRGNAQLLEKIRKAEERRALRKAEEEERARVKKVNEMVAVLIKLSADVLGVVNKLRSGHSRLINLHNMRLDGFEGTRQYEVAKAAAMLECVDILLGTSCIQRSVRHVAVQHGVDISRLDFAFPYMELRGSPDVEVVFGHIPAEEIPGEILDLQAWAWACVYRVARVLQATASKLRAENGGDEGAST